MENNLNRRLIETTIRKTLKQIQDDPERSTRNLVDMALNFSEGKFQQQFFETTQEMLKNEHSSYYKLVPDIVSTIDTERLVTFGMNLGYNSCTKGAKRIRAIEEKEQFNIPWSISLEISGLAYLERNKAYHSLIEQGQELGIYTWMIYSLDGTPHILELAEKFSECAFIIFCSPKEITNILLDEASKVNNLMLAVEYTDGIEDACILLRTRKFLYSIFYPYQECDVNKIFNGDFLTDAEILHPVFTALFAFPSCPPEIQVSVYQYILQTRAQQIYRTIPFDIIYDSYFIDGIISEEACSIGFSKEGKLSRIYDSNKYENFNCFKHPLIEILKQVSLKPKA